MITGVLLLLVCFTVCFITVSIPYLGYRLYVIRCYKKRLNNLSKNTKGQTVADLSVSIVIPTFNEEKVIKKKLENTLSLINPENRMEIIVVDDGSTDGTVDILKKFCTNQKEKISLILCARHQGKPSVLNAACKVAKGEIVLVTDADVFLSKKSIEASISNFSDPDIGAVCGRETIVNPYESFATRAEYLYRKFFHLSRALERTTDFPPIPFHGGLMAFRKELYTDLPPDTIGDDHEIALRIWRSGHKVIYEPKSIFFEHATQSIREIYQQKRRRAQGVVQCIMRNRDLFLDGKAGQFGRVRFPILILEFLVCPFAFLLGFASIVLYSLLASSGVLFLLLTASLIGIMIIVCLAMHRSLKDVTSAISGLFIFQAAMAHAVLDAFFGKPGALWRKIEGQRRILE